MTEAFQLQHDRHKRSHILDTPDSPFSRQMPLSSAMSPVLTTPRIMLGFPVLCITIASGSTLAAHLHIYLATKIQPQAVIRLKLPCCYIYDTLIEETPNISTYQSLLSKSIIHRAFLPLLLAPCPRNGNSTQRIKSSAQAQAVDTARINIATPI